MASHLLFNSGSNESSLAPQFKWLDNTFKESKNTGAQSVAKKLQYYIFFLQ
jgi:hypothetical protein